MHQILAVIDSVRAVFKDASDANPVFLTTEEKKTAITELIRIGSQALELRLRVEAVAQDLADQECARDVGAVIAAANLDDPRHAHSTHKLSQGLERYERVRAGLAAGDFTGAHARAIVDSLDALPDDIPAAVVRSAEIHLCDLATRHQPGEMRFLGKAILDKVAPEIAEEALGKALKKEDTEVARKATLSITPQGDGTTKVFGILPDAVGVRLKTVLESYAQPRKTALDADGRVRPRGRLMADALETLLERIDPTTLPAHGGDATTVIVTVPLASLRKDLGLATMADGTLITASEARRLACSASILPAVLDGKSEVLDLGRAKRLYTPAQRKAMAIRDKHCRAEGCTVPTTWCDAHHLHPWSRGGKTDIADGILLCGHHHRRIHDPKYETSRMPSGDYRFHLRR